MLDSSVLRQRGDTIIEVLLAVTVFSLAAVGALVVMNQGTNASQRALEVTLVKQQIDSQAEALRAAQQDYFVNKSNGTTPAPNTPAAAWQQAAAIDASSETAPSSDAVCPAINHAFAMNGRNGRYVDSAQLVSTRDASAPPYAQVVYGSDDPTDGVDYTTVSKAYGIWITRQNVGSLNTVAAYDFTIHACWDGPGSQVPMQLQTTVRLYDAP